MPKKLHYIFDSRAPQSTAKPLQDLIVLKRNAAHCRRWVRAGRGCEGSDAVNWVDVGYQRLRGTAALSKPAPIIAVIKTPNSTDK